MGWVLLVVVLMVIHGNAVNDIADFDIDKLNLADAKDRPLVSGDVSVRELWTLQGVCGLAAMLLSIVFGPVAALATTAVVIYNYVYSLRPFRITDRTLMSPLTLASTYAFLPFTLGYFASNQVSGYPWVLVTALYVGFIARLLLKDFRDVAGDEKYGKRTFLLRYGARATCIISGISAIMSLGLMSVGTNFNPGVFVTLLVGNVAALRLLVHLVTARTLIRQALIIGFISKIGNSSILTVAVYFACRSYLADYPHMTLYLPFAVGFILLLSIWRSYSHGSQAKFA